MNCGVSQLQGCLTRMAIERKRSVRGTCCEFCSHLILILILVFGYSLSIIVRIPDQIYSKIDISIPPSGWNTAQGGQTDVGTVVLNQYNALMNGPLIVPNLDQYIVLGNFLREVSAGYIGFLSSTGFTNSFTNLLYRGSLHFSPNTDATYSLINHLNSTYSNFQTLDVYVHDSEDDAINAILNNLDETTLALISLFQITQEKVNYAIRQNYTTLPSTNDVIITPAIGINQNYQQYFFSGFLTLQSAVDDWIFQYLNVTSTSSDSTKPEICQNQNGPINPLFIPYPVYKYDQNPFYTSVGFLLGLVMVMSTLYPMSKLTKSIVEEKETKMRELMMIMGLKPWVHSISWFLFGFILFFWIAISTFFITSTSFLIKSNKVLLFIYFFLFCMSEIQFAFLISVFFSNAKLAAIAGPVALFASLLPRYIFYTTSNNVEIVNKLLACLLSPTAFSFGADIIAQYEYANVGIQTYNMFQDKFHFGYVLMMLFFDFYLYAFLAWYLDQVIPHEYGTAKHPLFLLDYKYWCSCCECFYLEIIDDGNENIIDDIKSMPEFANLLIDRTTLQEEGLLMPNQQRIEQLDETFLSSAKIHLKKVGKRYSDGKVAVRNVTLTMLENQITCLLGHNGAGNNTLHYIISSSYSEITSPWENLLQLLCSLG
jgi:ATP-binding cassette, subfamily A (ABC1), member 3